jgi:hypothetical protein
MKTLRIGHLLMGAVFFVGAFSVESAHSARRLCYIPGVGGAKGYAWDKLPAEMEKREIPFTVLQIPTGKSVAEIAPTLCFKILELKKADPELECDVFAYSMGGILSRYAYHHLECPLPAGGVLPFRSLVRTLTTAATPHHGTPLANWLVKQYPNARPEMVEMSEENILKFWNPQNTKYYSPGPSDIPLFSFRSYITGKDEAVSWAEYFGIELLTQKLKEKNFTGPDLLSDGVVPLKSQIFGEVLEDLNVPHSFFGSHGDQIPNRNLADLLENHFRMLQLL